MGIFQLWLLWRSKDLLEQIRRNQLTPAERAAEDMAKEAKENEEIADRRVAFLIILIAIVSLLIVRFFTG